VSKIHSFVPQKIINYELQCISKRRQDSGNNITKEQKELAVLKMKQFIISLQARIFSFLERLFIRIIASKFGTFTLFVNFVFLIIFIFIIYIFLSSEMVRIPKGIKIELKNDNRIVRIIIDVKDDIQFSSEQN
jgi:hypothetical protein